MGNLQTMYFWEISCVCLKTKITTTLTSCYWQGTVLTWDKCFIPNNTWSLAYFQKAKLSSDSIPFQACFESSPKSLPCSRHYAKIPTCCPSSKGKQWRAFMVVMGRVRVSRERVPLFFNLVLCLHFCQSFSMSACLFFCLFICIVVLSVSLTVVQSVSQPVHLFFLVFPCLLWHCLPTFLLPDSVCLTLRLSAC